MSKQKRYVMKACGICLGVIKSADDECTIQWPHNKNKSYSPCPLHYQGGVAVQRELLAQLPTDYPPELQSTS